MPFPLDYAVPFTLLLLPLLFLLGKAKLEKTEQLLMESARQQERLRAAMETDAAKAVEKMREYEDELAKLRRELVCRDEEVARLQKEATERRAEEEASRQMLVRQARAAVEGLSPAELFEVVRYRYIDVRLEEQAATRHALESSPETIVTVCLGANIDVQSYSNDNVRNGCVLIEAWDRTLRVLAWNEEQDRNGDDPTDIRIQNDVEKAFRREEA